MMSWVSQVATQASTVVVTAAVTAGLLRGHRFATWVGNWFRDDHQPIRFGSVGVFMPPGSTTDGVRVVIICAPSRTIRKARFDPGQAVRFVQAHFAEQFPHPPTSSGSEAVRFERTPGVFGTDYLWVNAKGRLDLGMTVATTQTAAARASLNVLDLLRPIALLAAATRSPDYWRILGADKAPRCPGFDWMIGTSIDISDREVGSRVAWDELAFPGRVPSRASEPRLLCPPAGYAANELTGRRSDAPLEELLRPFLKSFLTENGYHDVDSSIDDVLAGRQGP